MDLIAEDYEFTAPDTIPSGWIIVRMHNQGSETHYMEIDQLPEGKTAEDFRTEYVPVRDSLEQLRSEGAIGIPEVLRALARRLPGWAGFPTEPRNAGGVGLLAPGETARTTLHLEPGTYVMTCTMPTANGRSHRNLGMARPIVVADTASGGAPPEPDVTMRYPGDQLVTRGQFTTGEQTVMFQVDASLSGGRHPKAGAHLVHLGTDTDTAEVRRWVTEEGYRNPAPADFLGGADEVPAGDSAYVTLDMEPGRYAWVVVPFGSDAPLLIEDFTVE